MIVGLILVVLARMPLHAVDHEEKECHWKSRGEFPWHKCFAKSDTKPNVLLFGDSHAAHYIKTLKSIKGINLMYATFSNLGKENCLYDPASVSHFDRFVKTIYEKMVPQMSPELILISCRWTSKYKSDVENTLKILKDRNFKIIGQNPEYTKSYPDIWDVEQESGTSIRNKYIKNLTQTNIDMQSWFGEPYVDIYNLPVVDTEHCLHMSDGNHFTKCGANQIINQIGPILFDGILKLNLTSE